MSASEPTHEASPEDAAPIASADAPLLLSTGHRIAELRAELELQEAKSAKAIVIDAIGHLASFDRAEEAGAPRELVAAYNLDPTFRPPLFALVDGFERKRSLKNLDRLYDAEVKSARGSEDRIDALLDRAFVLDVQGSSADADALLDQALEAGPERAGAWAVLEMLARHRGRDDLARVASRARAERAKTAALRAVLLHEAAVEAEADPKAALALLIEASKADPSSPRILTALDGAARLAGEFDVVVEALARRAEAEADVEPSLAAALFVEASALVRSRLGDGARALAWSGRAVELAMDDPLAWLEHLEAAEAAEDYERVERASARLLELAGDSLGAFSAVIHLRRAEAATALGRSDDAARHLEGARARAPGSETLALLASPDTRPLLGARRDALRSRAEAAPSVEARLEALHALAALDAAEGDVTQLGARIEAFASTLDASREPRALEPSREGDTLRDLVLLAVATGAALPPEVLAPRLLFGLEAPALDEERSAWRLTTIALAASQGRFGIARDAAAAALDDAACASWAPEVAIVFGARAGDEALVARAHEHAARGASADVAWAHAVARARSLVRANELDEAQRVLTEAVSREELDAYGRALLEEVGRARGDVEALLATLRESSANAAPEVLSAQLSSTAHVAEAEGNVELAARSAEEALARDPASVEARLLLARLALRSGDAARAHRVRDGLPAPVWSALRGIDPSTPASERESLLTSLLEDASVGVESALALRTMPSASEPARASAAARLGPDLALGPDPLDPIRAGRAGAWLALADELRNEDGAGDSADEVATFALRMALLAGELDDDAFLRMAELEDVDGDVRPDPALVSSEIVLDALLRGESSDLSELVTTHARHVEGAAVEPTSDVALAQLRLLVATGRGDQALAALRDAVDRAPEDPATLDALRVAAREAKAWPDVVRACDALATLLERVPSAREYAAELLEEAAAVSMDERDDVEAAEDRCRRALALDPDREIAYARLHDLLAERGDDPALLELVMARSERIDDPERLAPLLYEQARLFRGLGQIDEALATLENLLLLEPEHVGGLALQVEIHVQREDFGEAVESLRALASAESAPSSQRRIARLGAAEFLEKKLGDAAGALAELEAIETELGMADKGVYERIAALAMRSGRSEDAARAQAKLAASAGSPEERAAAFRGIGERARREGRLEDAAAAFASALDARPDDVDAAEALAEIPAASDVQERVEAASVALRAGAFPVTSEHLARIERIVRLAGDWGLSSATQQLVRALSGGPGEPADVEIPRLRPLDEAKLSVVVGIGEEPMLALARLVEAVLIEAEPLTPSALGATPKDAKPRGGGDAAADLLHAVTSQLGASGDVYIVGEGRSFGAGVSGTKPFYVAGASLRSPLALAYEAAYFATGARAALPALTLRAARSGAAGVATTFLAACAAGGVLVPGADTTGGFTERARALSGAASKRSKRFAELAGPIGSAARVSEWCQAFEACLVRMAVIVSGDLARGLGVLSGATGRVPILSAEGPGTTLARLWLSDEVIAARARFGWRAGDP